MLALVGTVMLRSVSGKVLLREGDGILGPHRLDLATAPDAEDRLQKLMDTYAPRSIVLDLSRTEFLGSAGVAVLMRLRRRALSGACEVPCLVGLTGAAQRTLHGLGLLELFSTADAVPKREP